MKKIFKRVIPATLALSLAAAPVVSQAAEFKPSPGKPYAPEVMAKLEDNMMEYGEIEMLIDTYNTTLENLRDSYGDSKNSMKDIEKVKEQIYSGSEQMLDGAAQMSSAASQLEGSIGFGLPIPGLTFVCGTCIQCGCTGKPGGADPAQCRSADGNVSENDVYSDGGESESDADQRCPESVDRIRNDLFTERKSSAVDHIGRSWRTDNRASCLSRHGHMERCKFCKTGIKFCKSRSDHAGSQRSEYPPAAL